MYFHTASLGGFLGLSDLGEGVNEGIIAPGDSGGPALIDGKVAGVASYTASLSQYGFDPDINQNADSSYGEIAAWQRVSFYDEWIDKALRAHYPNTPSDKSEIKFTLTEGEHDYAYFWVEYQGLRVNPLSPLSVDYQTMDGTAKAGEDYVAVSGTLIIYSDEDHALIGVELINDVRTEGAENFYLKIFNPVGGSLEGMAPELIAFRTILDNDSLIA